MNEKVIETRFDTFGTLVLLAAFTGIFWLVNIFLKKYQLYKKAASIPDYKLPKKLYFGLALLRKTINESFVMVTDLFKHSPEVYKLWLGGTLIVGISKPEHMEIIFTDPNSLDKSLIFDLITLYMGHGLLTAPVHMWKRNRKLLNPTFNQRILNSFISIFADNCDILMEILEKEVGKSNIDIKLKFANCTLDNICDSAMGQSVDAQTTPNTYNAVSERALELITVRIFNFMYHNDKYFYLTKPGVESIKLSRELNEFSQKIIKKRKEMFEEKMRKEYIEDEEPTKLKTLLELLLEISYNGNHFTEKQLQDEVNTFISAGTDTSSTAMSFCCVTMGLYPEYQQKLYEEAIEVLGHDRHPGPDDFPKLKFMDMFLKETLRLFPVAPLLVRAATGDVHIDDYVIPKGTVILLGILHMQRNPKYWDDPLKFNPYRFSPEEWSKKHPYSHLPFSGGPRKCIGYQYAMMMMKLILAKLIRKFRVKTEYKSIEEVELKIHLMNRPSNGFKVSLELRE